MRFWQKYKSTEQTTKEEKLHKELELLKARVESSLESHKNTVKELENHLNENVYLLRVTNRVNYLQAFPNEHASTKKPNAYKDDITEATKNYNRLGTELEKVYALHFLKQALGKFPTDKVVEDMEKTVHTIETEFPNARNGMFPTKSSVTTLLDDTLQYAKNYEHHCSKDTQIKEGFEIDLTTHPRSKQDINEKKQNDFSNGFRH